MKFEIDFTKTLEENIIDFTKYAREKCMRVDDYYTELALILAKYIDYKLKGE